MSSHHTITRILQGAAYSSDIIDDVLPLVYEEMRTLAAHFLSKDEARSMNTTDLVHEAYVKMFGDEEPAFRNRRHFFSTAGMAMRRILVDQERLRRSGKKPSSAKIMPIEKALGLPKDKENSVDILELDRALDALGQLSKQQARIVELRFFGGLSSRQIGDVMDISRDLVERELRAAKLWLRREMRV